MALRDDLAIKANKAKGDVALARRKAAASSFREIQDPVWLTRAEGFVRLMGSRTNRINTRLSELKALEKQANIAASETKTASDSKLFVEHAKRILDREVYLQIWASVDRVRMEERAGR
jgi:hypothetical protein